MAARVIAITAADMLKSRLSGAEINEVSEQAKSNERIATLRGVAKSADLGAT